MKANGTDSVTWTPANAQSIATSIARLQSQLGGMSSGYMPAVRPGYELMGPYNSMQKERANPQPYMTRAQLLEQIGGTPIKPLETKPAAPAIGSFFGINPAVIAAAQARAATPATPLVPLAVSPNFMGFNPAIALSNAGRLAAPTEPGQLGAYLPSAAMQDYYYGGKDTK